MTEFQRHGTDFVSVAIFLPAYHYSFDICIAQFSGLLLYYEDGHYEDGPGAWALVHAKDYSAQRRD